MKTTPAMSRARTGRTPSRVVLIDRTSTSLMALFAACEKVRSCLVMSVVFSRTLSKTTTVS